MLVPVLDEVIADSAAAGVRHVIVGMAHRGRLNVMAHVLQKSYASILAEFKEPRRSASAKDLGWTGDVKYHSGARTGLHRGRGALLRHLDAAEPEPPRVRRSGRRRHGARGGRPTLEAGRPAVDATKALAILIHGDAAFPGQGVVAETLNLCAAARLQRGAARSTSSPTTSSGSPPRRRSPTAPRTPAAWRAASRSRSST
jgi:2-oxoglutarate dehydrogenase E1 component